MLAAVAVLAVLPVVGAAQKRVAGFIEPMPTAKLQQLFPQAGAFTPRGDKDPLHFTAYAANPQAPGAKPIGFAFWTPDINPEELGYHGHIHMLVGMNMTGTLTGVIVDWNTEPYGDFSVEPAAFGAQFKGKSIRDAFLVGKDVDIVSRATITVRAAARTIRESSRTVARALLTPGAVKD